MIPAFLKSCLWSYDLSRLDKKKDKRLIITQIINYGDNKQLSWLKKNYSQKEVKEVISHPNRGLWFREKLRFWLGFFNVMIDPLEFEVAILDLNPRIKLMRAFFERKGR